MAFELYYTSAPQGLKPGTSGFCTVAATTGLPAAIAERLESLSSYQPLFATGTPEAPLNPVAFSHWRFLVGGRTRSVLSRICCTGFDYTRRPNKLAYHLIPEPGEQSPAGPAWLMLQPNAMATEWMPPPRMLSANKPIPSGDSSPRRCSTWEHIAGDAGWAGLLVEAFLADPSRASYIICQPSMQLLPMLDEAISLLPARFRWQVTFGTYFNELPAGLGCAWRCVMAGTLAAKEAQRYATSGILIDLTHPPGLAPDRPASQAARCGAVIAAPATSVPDPSPGPKDQTHV